MAGSTIWAPVGDKGPDGDQGPTGNQGPVGPQGPPGPGTADFLNNTDVNKGAALIGLYPGRYVADITSKTNPALGGKLIGYSGRTVTEALADWINVKDVAAANPTLTWSQVFTLAQTLLPSTGFAGRQGGIVWIPPGDYSIANVVKKPGVIFQGAGFGTRIINNNTTSFAFISANTGGIQDHGGFRDIVFDGGDPASTSGGSLIGYGAINIAAMHNSFVDNCLFQRFAGRAISNQNTLSVKFRINQCFISGNATGVLLSDGMSTALHMTENYFAFNDNAVLLTGQSDFRIHNNIIEQSTFNGLRIDGTIDQGTVLNNYFEQNGFGTGGSKLNAQISNGKSVEISGNLFNMLGSASGSSGSGWGHIFLGDLDNLIIDGNTFNSGAGITGTNFVGAFGSAKAFLNRGNTAYSGSSFTNMDATALARSTGVGRYKSLTVNNNITVGSAGIAFPGRWNDTPLVMNGSTLWVDGSGKLRLIVGNPTSDTSGVVVGTQT